MPTSNFLIFDQNKANMIGDEAYQTSTQRLNGVQSGVASSMLNNKFAYQVSLVAYAIAQIMNQNGIDATDTMAVSQFVNNLSSTFLQKVVDKASVEDAVAASSDSKWMSPKTVKSMLQHMGTGWQLLQKWEEAGTYTWTAPDLLGNGQTYEIGILLIGGGGSGKAIGRFDGQLYCYGGGAGNSKTLIIKVSPGDEIQIIVGEGGKNIAVTGSVNIQTYGNEGEKTSISLGEKNYEALGGIKGDTTSSGSSIGINRVVSQLPSFFVNSKENHNFGGSIYFLTETNVNTFRLAGLGFVDILQCFDIFTQNRILGAGGSIRLDRSGQSGYQEQDASYDEYGVRAGGPGLVYNVTAAGQSFIGIDGNLPGSGGGSLGVSNNSLFQTTIKAGDGADGACYIYVSSALKQD